MILRLGRNNSLRAFAFVSNQQKCFLPTSCCFLPPLWDPFGLNISAQIKRVNLAAKQSPPIFTETFILVHAPRNVISTVVKNSAKFTKGDPFLRKEGSFMFGFRYFIVSGLQRS